MKIAGLHDNVHLLIFPRGNHEVLQEQATAKQQLCRCKMKSCDDARRSACIRGEAC